MGKKVLILSQKQINEITGGAYLNTSSNDFTPNGCEVFTNTFSDNNDNYDTYSAKTTDDFSGKMANHLGGFSPFFGSGHLYPVNKIYENNTDIANKSFQLSPTAINNIGNNVAKDSVGSNAILNGISGENLPEYVHRFKEAKKEAAMGDSSKLNNMGGIVAANEIERLYTNVRKQSKNRRNANGNKIKSAPKNSGNGKGHEKKNNGIISYM